MKEKEGIRQDHEIAPMPEPQVESLVMEIYNTSNPFREKINVDELDEDTEYILDLDSRRVYFKDKIRHDKSGFYFYKINEFNEIIEIYTRICHKDEYYYLNERPDFLELIKDVKNKNLHDFINNNIIKESQENLALNKRYNCLISCETDKHVAIKTPIEDSIYIGGFKNNILKEFTDDKKKNIIYDWFDFNFQIFMSIRFNTNFEVIANEYIFLSEKDYFIKDLYKLKNDYFTEKHIDDIIKNFSNSEFFKKNGIQYRIRFNVLKNIIDRIYIKSIHNDFYDETIENFKDVKD